MKISITIILLTTFSQTTANCVIWPRNLPIEHDDTSCDLELQNSQLKSHEEFKAPLNLYLQLPEEKTWSCPLEDDNTASVDTERLVIGRATNWILYNEASTPIIVERVNDSPLVDVWRDEGKSAVYPHGPVVLPGDMAVVNGYEGQLFTAREYKEDIRLLSLNNEYSNSFRNSLPRTWAFAAEETQYVNKMSGVIHVLGSPGRVLMKHQMGLVHIKNEYGALCPESFGGVSNAISNRTDGPVDLDPHCNFVSKAMINKVGCPIDLYYAPPKKDPNSSVDCEVYMDHMGSLDQFSKSNITDFESFDSPVIFQKTYNTHSFVARTSHDKSLVARIEIDADIVHDCPVRKSSVVNVEVTSTGAIMRRSANVANYSSNDTRSFYESYATLKRNPTNIKVAHYANNLTFHETS